MSQQPDLTETEAFNQAIGLAHAEDVATWSTAIAQWLEVHRIATVPLVQLQRDPADATRSTLADFAFGWSSHGATRGIL